MTKPRPQVGDIWVDTYNYNKWLIVDRYFHKPKNTHFLSLRNLRTGSVIEESAVYIREKWDYEA